MKLIATLQFELRRRVPSIFLMIAFCTSAFGVELNGAPPADPFGDVPPAPADAVPSAAWREKIPKKKHPLEVKSLDLSSTDFDDLWDLSGYSNLTALHLRKTKLTSLDGIGQFKHLQDLVVDETAIREIGPLRACRELRTLSLQNCPVKDLSAISSLRLNFLCIDNTKVEVLATMDSLTGISLKNTGVADLTPVSKSMSLRLFVASGSSVADLSPLSNCASIDYMDLRSTLVSDLSPTANFRELRNLIVAHTPVGSLDPLKKLTKLYHVDISETKVVDLKPLEGLHLLQMLVLDDTGVSDLTPLRNCKRLSSLYCSQTAVSDISVLANFPGMSFFRFRRARLKPPPTISLKSLSFCKSLTVLDLSNVVVDNLEPLARCERLQGLHLQDVPVNNLSPLSKLQHLETLHIQNAAVTDLTPLESCHKLSHLHIDKIPVSDLTTLLRMKKLRYVVIADIPIEEPLFNELRSQIGEVFLEGAFQKWRR
ncbi:leucine-rich repeat domain-containing protein [Anatilimnocola floriformis]|uniref:leucine-rich repeat domain-containing protein n=1 Tax=Anatilimnocola floriformis TaxID=2948575 RepID=UPI0020C42410|nr:hypothetical protein [Anatilimnocola floriformis]